MMHIKEDRKATETFKQCLKDNAYTAKEDHNAIETFKECLKDDRNAIEKFKACLKDEALLQILTQASTTYKQ